MPPILSAQCFSLDRIAMRPQPLTKLIYHGHWLKQQQVISVGRPWSILQYLSNRLTTHARDRYCVTFFGRNAIQTGSEPQRQDDAMLLGVSRRMIERAFAQI